MFTPKSLCNIQYKYLFSLYQIFVILQVGYYNQSCRSCGLYFCYLYFICIHVYFIFFRWATDFKDKLVSGEISSLTKAKDIACTVHWRNYSTQYDSKRAVQQPTANPGTGHRV